MDILDAAEVFHRHPDVFERIRAHFPGPFPNAVRIPAFEGKTNSPTDLQFLEEVRDVFDVHNIQVWTDAGNDQIYVTLAAYGFVTSGSSVSLIYYESFSPSVLKHPDIALFDACDETALEWLDTDHGSGYSEAYCKLDPHWYAYEQRH